MFLGYWPHYDHPDPKNLPENFLPATAWLDWGIPVIGLILGSIGLALLLRKIPNYKMRMFVGSALLFGGWLAGLILLLLDPADLFEWICD